MWVSILIANLMIWPLYAGIVSLDLCADQWLLGFSKREDIHSISYLAKDSELSYLSHQARFLRTHSGAAEGLLLDSSINTAIGYEPISPTIKKLCRKRGIKLISLSYPQSFQELKNQIKFLSRSFHQIPLGNKWIKQLTSPSCPSSHKAVFYGAHGFCPGNYTLLNEVLQSAGYENIYNNKKGWTHNSLESFLLSSSLSAVFFSDPLPSSSLWRWLEKKQIILKKVPYRLTLCPYPPAILELRDFLKWTLHAR